jgi:hypothetical protein
VQLHLPAPQRADPLVRVPFGADQAGDLLIAQLLLAQQFDLKVSHGDGKSVGEVTTADVLSFIEAPRAPRRGWNVVPIIAGESGLSAATIKRRLATVSSLFDSTTAPLDTDHPHSWTPP